MLTMRACITNLQARVRAALSSSEKARARAWSAEEESGDESAGDREGAEGAGQGEEVEVEVWSSADRADMQRKYQEFIRRSRLDARWGVGGEGCWKGDRCLGTTRWIRCCALQEAVGRVAPRECQSLQEVNGKTRFSLRLSSSQHQQRCLSYLRECFKKAGRVLLQAC